MRLFGVPLGFREASLRRWGLRCAAAVVLLVAGCTHESSGVNPTATGGIEPFTSSSTSASADVPSVAVPCVDDSDCGSLRCRLGECYGCDTREQCRDDQRCDRDYCVPTAEAPECMRFAAPVCGDGIIGALEECELATGCEECSNGRVPEPWFTSTNRIQVALAPSASAYTLPLSGGRELKRYVQTGGLDWSIELEERADSVCSDANGRVYVAGAYLAGAGFSAPWISSWNADQTERWSFQEASEGWYTDLVADDDRVVASGGAPQPNTPDGRALLVQYGLDGTMQWSEKFDGLLLFVDVALVGREIAAIGQPIYPVWSRTLVRVDEAGKTRWSVEVGLNGRMFDAAVTGVVGDRQGGTWIWGESRGGPWAEHHDAAGEEVERLDCVGETAGSLQALAVAQDGQLALGFRLEQGPLALRRSMPWVALLQDGVITSASRFDTLSELVIFDELAWRSDGRLVANVLDHPTTHVVLLDP